MSSIDTSRFGTGFVPDGVYGANGASSQASTSSSSWWWSSGSKGKGKGAKTQQVRPGEILIGGGNWDDDGAGGAVSVEGYHGRWPLYGDVYSLNNQKQQSQLSDGATSSSPFASSSTSGAGRDPGWLCRSVGPCRPCSREEIARPFCQPYGNKAPVECRKLLNASLLSKWVTGSTDDIFSASLAGLASSENATHTLLSDEAKSPAKEKGPMPLDARAEDASPSSALASAAKTLPPALGEDIYSGYQVCGRSIEAETWDYGEFMGLTLLVALISLFVLLQRQRYLAGQYRSILASRIGSRSTF